MNIYFDSAASTQLDDKVIETMFEAMRTNFANPSSSHASGKRAKETIETCRIKIANHFGAEPSEIVFTSCGTEANNLTLRYFLKDLGVTRIISSEIEHKSIWITAKLVAEEENIEICYVKVNDKGDVDLKHLEELLQASDKTTLVTLMHANNEIGTLLPLQEIGDLCKANKAYFHSDTVQTIGHYPLNFLRRRLFLGHLDGLTLVLVALETSLTHFGQGPEDEARYCLRFIFCQVAASRQHRL